ncbi:MAG: matrixin family metalloprotease [Ignavibacteriales bacterium]|nr:matrixin family metalloprotease [Ignavibacteriales bacterium]
MAKEVKRLGVYVQPTGQDHYEKIFANLLGFDILSRGYQVVQFNRLLNDSTQKNLSNSRNFETLTKSLIQLPFASNVDAIALALLKVGRYQTRLTPLYEGGRTRGPDAPYVDVRLAVIDARKGNLIFGVGVSDSVLVIREDGFFVYLEHKRFMLERTLVKALAKFPINEEEHKTLVQEIPIIFYVDEGYRDFFSRDWHDRLQRRLLFVNDIFSMQAGMEFGLKEIRKWQSWFTGDLSKSLSKLEQSDTSGNWFNVGVTFDRKVAKDWYKRNYVGIASPTSKSAVVTAIPAFPDLSTWNSLDESYTLAHEIGHVMGLPHVHDPQSLMFPSTGMMSYELDSVSLRMLKSFSKDILSLPMKDATMRRLNVFNAWFNSNIAPNVEFVHGVYTDIDHVWKLQRGFEATDTTNSIDSTDANQLLNQLISSQPLRLAVRGMVEIKHKRWEEALKFFEMAIKEKPDFTEAYQYIMSIHIELGNPFRSERAYNKILDLNPNWFEK